MMFTLKFYIRPFCKVSERTVLLETSLTDIENFTMNYAVCWRC